MKHIYKALFLLLLSANAKSQWITDCGQGDGMIVSFTSFNDTLYGTGFFTNICGANAKYIAKWDGTQWYPVDTGLREAGHRVEVLNNELYVAGYRQTQDSNWVLKWDGAHFQKLGEGVYLPDANVNNSYTANLYDVAMYNNQVVASGEFDSVGNKSIHCIMRWNGTSWDSLGHGITGSLDGSGIRYVHQLMVYNNNLYAVGNFVTAGSVVANGVAMWDGTQWQAMGAGFNKEVYGIAVFNGEIYAGGEFTLSGSTQLQRVAKWDGTQWVNPGFGVTYTNPLLHGYVHTLMQIGTHLVLEGGFDRAIINGVNHSCHSVLAYDGVNVDTMMDGIPNGEFEGLANHNGNVLVGGAIFGLGTDTTHVAEYAFPSAVNNVNALNVKVYPNPVADILAIEGLPTKGTITLYNMPGQAVYEQDYNSTVSKINIAKLPSGNYLLKIVCESCSASYRQVIVKQ
jgi:hypothetical protein